MTDTLYIPTPINETEGLKYGTYICFTNFGFRHLRNYMERGWVSIDDHEEGAVTHYLKPVSKQEFVREQNKELKERVERLESGLRTIIDLLPEIETMAVSTAKQLLNR